MHTEEEAALLYRTVCYTLPTMVPLQFQPPTDAERSVKFLAAFAIEFDQELPIGPTFAPLEILPQSAAPLSWHRHQQRSSSLVHLNFCELASLTVVSEQYQIWGVTFSGAIALQPSNPVFANPEQPIGLMPLTDRAPLTLHFDQPRQLVKVNLVGVKQIIVKSFNQAHLCLGEQYFGQSSLLSSINSEAPTHHEIQLWAPEISSIEIVSEAPFLIHSLTCG